MWFDNGLYHFKTENDVLLAIEFEEDETLSFKGSVWLNLINLSRKNSPTDPKVKRTVITIIEEFFRLNPTVILYLCDTADNQQAMRSRLFLHWFNDAESKSLFHIQVAEIQDEDVTNYIAIIVQRSNPEASAIIAQFDKEVEMFKNKP